MSSSLKNASPTVAGERQVLNIFGSECTIAKLDSAGAPWPKAYAETVKSAVCLLFIPGTNENPIPRLVFTRRTTFVRTHKGQIGLPGGIAEAQDKMPVDAALRELEEEVGILPECIKVHGLLSSQRALGDFPVFAVVASASIDEQAFKVSPKEVAELILVPVTQLQLVCAENFQFNILGQWRQSYLYPFEKHKIWGLTAKIIYSLALQVTTHQNKSQKSVQ